MNSFETLIQPLAVKDFWSQYHEKRHLHINSLESARFSHLISFGELDKILGTYGLEAPDISVVNFDKDICHTDYLWKRKMVDPVRVASLFADGNTVIFNALQDRSEPLRRLCSSLSEVLHLRTQTNVYLTPPNSQGFDTHWDTHDVFVLQVEGQKHWRIYEEHLKLPLENQKYKFEKDCIQADNVIDEFTLEQGDVLYIPRGTMHSACASNDKSLHITLGMIAYTWKDLYSDLIESLSDMDSKWRASVPLQSFNQDTVKNEFFSKLNELRDSFDAESLANRRSRVVSRSFRPRTNNLLSQTLNSSELEKSDVVRPHQHNNIKISESVDTKKITLNAGLREITFPISAKKTIDLIFNCDDQEIGGFDDDIDWESRKLVISKLLKEGLITKPN